ncbi:uncharacterized protein F4822DRAFT_404731 [Hypoxylon trugodes]|uniref:uncharacterized protein n=1 Tax=Hypoxylon trugodes TaxID=326681 RepID=UPI002199E168|nr:uncharacterized protein F4822DRAFT_404731 [Hypoxylon trugodes]KAI1389024.1 hypothetical protein F4822DRAFT_404731 [Hypoxylon trugodes]
MMSKFSSLSPAQQEAVLNGAALNPPKGYTSNFDDPPNREAATNAFFFLCLALATLAVFGRLYCRWILLKQYSLPDFLFIAGYALLIADIALVYRMAPVPVMFVHLWNIRQRDFIIYLRSVFITSEVYLFNITFIKVAILLDWIHIFMPRGTRNFLFWAASIAIFVNVGFYIGIIVANQVACTPYEYAWNKLIDGNCGRANTLDATVAAGAFNIVSDVVILLIPQRVVWKLHMPRQKKFGISIVFALGLLAVTTAILRFVSSLKHAKSPDFTYDFSEILITGCAELTCGILVGCVPSLPKVFASANMNGIKHKLSKSRLWSSFSSSQKRSSPRSMHSRPPSLELVPRGRAGLFHKLDYQATGFSESSTDSHIPVISGRIYQTTEFHTTETCGPSTFEH